MNSDRTEHQSCDELQKARELSLESSRPPAQIPGYKLQRFIGSGAYGEVWSAKDLKTGRRVAVKFYTRRSSADVQLLAQEVQKLVVLSNDSYVVGLLDVGWDADPPYYVMDYIESGSLEDRLKNGNGMSASEAVELFQDIATGMMLLHGKGILHCDLKPGNVLLDQNGKPRVADFGQSRLSTDETPALGTLFYMAPEQADMSAIPDAGWDVYGLGALLFSMLTGKPPYYCPELAETIEASEDIEERLAKYRESLITAVPPTEHRQVAGVDRGLADIIDKCIAADPKRRYSNVQSVLLALRERELVRARRPLMLLGLIGPILLMAVVSVFGWLAFDDAMSKFESDVTENAKKSNENAAELARSSATGQIEAYFRVVKQLARDDSFLGKFDEVMKDEELKKLRIQLADPRLNDEKKNPGLKQTRVKLAKHELRNALENDFLRSRMVDENNEYPKAASWFISDRYGNQIASVFDDKGNKTRGKNFAWRTYFTGNDDDLDADDSSLLHATMEDELLASRKIIQKPHLSARFKSEQSNTFKVAFSTPIFLNGEVQGIVAVTVNLGDLIEFKDKPTQYVMLVDVPVGQEKGAILHHPLFANILAEKALVDDGEPAKLPDELVEQDVDLSVEFDFTDPLGNTEDGKRFGYDREYFVSRLPVVSQDLAAQDDATDAQSVGLEVWAVQDYETIRKAARELGSMLGAYAALAGIAVVGLMIGMLLFVNRMMRESRERLARAFSPSMDSSGLHSMETVGAVTGSRNATHRPNTAGPSNPTDHATEK